MSGNVTLIDHPLVQHKISLIRKKETGSAEFRSLVHEVSTLITYEMTRDLPTRTVTIETPLEAMEAPVIEGQKIVLVAILRAGLGLIEGMLSLLPAAKVGHIGLYRDPKTLEAVEYYFKLPAEIQEHDVFLVDPMLATGNTAVAAVERIKELKPRSLRFVCLLAAPEGLKQMNQQHPDVPVFAAAMDPRLNDAGYILPGLGDAGDRLYRTK